MTDLKLELQGQSIQLGVLIPGDILPVPDNRAIVFDDVDGTKRMRIEASTIATATTRVLTMPDADITPDDQSAARTPTAHFLGGAEHSADTLTNLNSKVSDATLIDTGDSRLSDARTPIAHGLGGAEHNADTLANLNSKVSDATLIDTGDSRLSDDRTASGLRSATTVVAVASATAPSTGQVLTALDGASADWQTPSGGNAFAGFTEGSVTFIGSGGGVVAEDNANLFWDDTNNRLGIGTATPSHDLDIEVSGDPQLVLQSTGNARAIALFTQDGGGSSTVQVKQGAAGTERWVFGIKSNDDCFIGRGGEPEKITILGNGNVGIGDQNPAEKLTVSGDIKATGDLGVNGAVPARPSVTGSRGGNAALASLLTGLASIGLITDNTTA